MLFIKPPYLYLYLLLYPMDMIFHNKMSLNLERRNIFFDVFGVYFIILCGILKLISGYRGQNNWRLYPPREFEPFPQKRDLNIFSPTNKRMNDDSQVLHCDFISILDKQSIRTGNQARSKRTRTHPDPDIARR